jgi:hypothetical protein
VAGATCRLLVREQYMPPLAVAAGATCRFGELAATTQVVFFVNFIRMWYFLTIHSWRWSFLPKIRILLVESFLFPILVKP